MSAPQVFANEADLGAFAAAWILPRLLKAQRDRGVMVLGCPSGRSPRSTYGALARLAAESGCDLSGLHLVMMDEFVVARGARWARCSADAHFSCARFGELEIRQVFNALLPTSHRLPAENLHVPDPEDPEAYENLIDRLGGIDVFLLASGASDGHVAFNPPGTLVDARTRVVRLAEATRQDNLGTFPAFTDLAEVPQWGVSVGPGTIARASRSAVMILCGPAKAQAFGRITNASGYEADWPATVVNVCSDGLILADRAAASEA